MESVWSYPRPPALERCAMTARVEFGGTVIAESDHALRVLETSHPPVIYLPAADVGHVYPSKARGTVCEWKGQATYLDVRVGDRTARAAAWTYRSPVPRYEALRDHVAFYPSLMDGCFLGDERVSAQPGDFYGGWITADIEGPFKGGPGTFGW